MTGALVFVGCFMGMVVGFVAAFAVLERWLREHGYDG